MDLISEIPPNFVQIGQTDNCKIAAMENIEVFISNLY